jgi:hypothetical protein
MKDLQAVSIVILVSVRVHAAQDRRRAQIRS